MTTEYLSAPVDPISETLLAERGLRLAAVDTADPAAFEAWYLAVGRGFLEGRATTAVIDQARGYFAPRRCVGVWDATIADPSSPVGSIAVWGADLTVPGRASVPAWAISDVTVAPTHRRRGIASALLEAELRTASDLGYPVAMLTVSESTIYGRFGFAPSALARELTIESKRARWTGPIPDGRVQFVTQQQLLVDGYELVERMRLATPGQIEYGGLLWDRQVGLSVEDENAKHLRFLRYDDADGVAQGFVVYRLTDTGTDYSKHGLTVTAFVAATDDAYAGLWRFLLEHDLVATITASLRPVDEPLRWMIADFRAITTKDVDHLWTRILDVKRALEARRYGRAGRVVLEITDPLGFAAGTWALEVDPNGIGTVTASDEQADAGMSANELAAIYLGGVAPSTLARAGRIRGDADALDALFVSSVAPWLSIWF